MGFLFKESFNGFEHLESLFTRAVDAFSKDPRQTIPSSVLDVLARTDQPRFVILGTKDFGSAFASYVKDKMSVAYVVDDFKAHKGETFCDVEIISSDRLIEEAKKDKNLIALNSCRFDYSKRFFEFLCRDHNIPCLNFEQAIRLFNLNDSIDHRHADWLNVILERSDAYQQLAKRLADPYSVQTLYSVLMFHLTCDPDWHTNISRPYSTLYFRSGLFGLSDHERLVDCGASIGESTTALIDATRGQFDRSWMIEPDRFNVVTLGNFLRKHQNASYASKLSLHPVAVGEHEGTVPFQHVGWHGGSICVASKGNGDVSIRTVDSLVDAAPTIIKMDIEGAEVAALRGASQSIRSHKPKLLLSAYHRSTDLLEIPALIDGLRDDYKIGIRHHTEDRWDTCLYFY